MQQWGALCHFDSICGGDCIEGGWGGEGAAALQVRPIPRAYHYFRLSVAQQEEGEEPCEESQPDGGAPGSHSRSIPNVSHRQLVPPARRLFPNNSAHASAGSNFKWQLVIQESNC